MCIQDFNSVLPPCIFPVLVAEPHYKVAMQMRLLFSYCSAARCSYLPCGIYRISL